MVDHFYNDTRVFLAIIVCAYFAFNILNAIIQMVQIFINKAQIKILIEILDEINQQKKRGINEI